MVIRGGKTSATTELTRSVFSGNRCRPLSWVKVISHPVAHNQRAVDREGVPVTEISEAMAGHHARCDDLFAAVLAAAAVGDRNRASAQFRRFAGELEHHLEREEAVLFAAFEAATGVTAGPTGVMRGEHDRIRTLLAQIEDALSSQNMEGVDGHASTLLIMMQQHNLKEENILYPMFDAVLGARSGELVPRLELERDPANA
jgi:DUF438 domain-containing protein